MKLEHISGAVKVLGSMQSPAGSKGDSLTEGGGRWGLTQLCGLRGSNPSIYGDLFWRAEPGLCRSLPTELSGRSEHVLGRRSCSPSLPWEPADVQLQPVLMIPDVWLNTLPLMEQFKEDNRVDN